MGFSDSSRVFVQYRQGNAIMAQLLDLAYVNGKPIAVVSWVVRCGLRHPGDYVQLDPALLRPSAMPGTSWYGGIAVTRSRSSAAADPAE